MHRKNNCIKRKNSDQRAGKENRLQQPLAEYEIQ